MEVLTSEWRNIEERHKTCRYSSTQLWNIYYSTWVNPQPQIPKNDVKSSIITNYLSGIFSKLTWLIQVSRIDEGGATLYIHVPYMNMCPHELFAQDSYPKLRSRMKPLYDKMFEIIQNVRLPRFWEGLRRWGRFQMPREELYSQQSRRLTSSVSNSE
jgi:hypothetical protein